MDDLLLVQIAGRTDQEFNEEFRILADFIGRSPEDAFNEALREWMMRYAVIHHCPRYGFEVREGVCG